MEHEFEKLHSGGKGERISLYAGIGLSYLDVASGSFSRRHEAPEHIIQVNYCRAGQVVWNTQDDGSIFLNPGDFSLHMPDACPESRFHFPTGQYQGLTIWIDLQEATAHPPELIAETGILGALFGELVCRDSAVLFLAGNEQTESIFSAFYDQPEELKLPYQRIKVLELLLYLTRMEFTPQNRLTEYPPEQIELVREIHDQMLRHMERRITIKELSKQYLINPTTLKAAFKTVYGTSVAAHIKRHRMDQAAKLLRETDRSIAEIAAAVGYESQGKFAAAFKSHFQVLPRDFRKHVLPAKEP